MTFKDRPEYNSPEYKAFRFGVMTRDGFGCQLCSSKEQLEVHHILPFSQCIGVFDKLKFAKSNGITLCKDCHTKVTGHEKEYEDQLRKLVSQRMIATYGENIKRSKNTGMGFKRKWRPKNPRNFFQ